MTDSEAWELRKQVDQLSKSGNHDEAIALGESAIGHHPGFAPLATAVGWAFYRRDLSGLDDQQDLNKRRRAKAALERIAELCESDLYGKYSPWPTAALKMADVMSKRWPAVSLDFLARLDSERLAAEKDCDFEPPRARWAMIRTKALEAAGRWNELLPACDEALGAAWIGEDNKHWVTLRRCEALCHLGRTEEAEPILREKAEKAREWWLFERLAQVQTSLQRKDESIGTTYRALNSTRVTFFQWRVVFFLGSLIADRDPALAAKHAQLARAFRREQGWPADKDLEALCVRLGVKDAVEPSSKELVDELSKTWRHAEDAQRQTGRVVRHINEGSGFIQPDSGGEAVYFCRPKSSNLPLPLVGAPVNYLLQNSFDKKKNQESARAVKWREIEN